MNVASIKRGFYEANTYVTRQLHGSYTGSYMARVMMVLTAEA